MRSTRFTRRALMAGIAATVAGLSLRAIPAFAQNDDENTYFIEYDGQLISASREYLASGLRLSGAMRYNFAVLEFDSPEHARAAFEEASDSFLTGYSEAAGLVLTDTSEVSTPKVGDDRYGQVTKTSIDGTELALSFLYVLDGILVHVWGNFGLVDAFAELADIAEEFFAQAPSTPVADTGTPETYAEILAQLPALENMPSGFALESERVKEY